MIQKTQYIWTEIIGSSSVCAIQAKRQTYILVQMNKNQEQSETWIERRYHWNP